LSMILDTYYFTPAKAYQILIGQSAVGPVLLPSLKR